MKNEKEIRISKFMSLILRHHPEKIGIALDEHGWADVMELIEGIAKKYPFDMEMLEKIVREDEKQRYAFRPIIEKEAIAWAVGLCDNKEIDKMNILKCSIEAMHRAVRALKVRPEALLIDGNRFYPFEDIPHTTIVKGDGKMMSIAAASVLAKTYRDDFMMQIDKEFPAYNWRVNKGYPTKDHRAAIAKEGPCKYHRMTFRLLAVEDKTNNIFSE